MKYQKNLLVLALLASVAVTGTAQASLVDRGNGLIYDTDLNITWLANANLAASNTFGVAGIGADGAGRMDWPVLQSWLAGMNSTNYLGYSDWRLPTTPNLNSSIGNNQTSSELGHLFGIELGLQNGNFIAITQNASYNLFNNIQNYVYWSGTESDSLHSWFYNTTDSFQSNDGYILQTFNAWAVRSGDVSSVPVPGAVWLFGSGLLVLLGFKKRKVV